MRADQITLIRQLKSQGKSIQQIAGQVGVEMGDVQTAVTMLDFMAQDSGLGVSHLRIVSSDFTFDTPGLLEGVTVYRPTPGELLLNAWVEIGEAWDGTSPHADIGTFVGDAHGLFGNINVNSPLGLGDAAEDLGGLRVQYASGASLASLIGGGSPRFTSEDPLKLAVSQDGTAGGADPVATQGHATLHLLVASP